MLKTTMVIRDGTILFQRKHGWIETYVLAEELIGPLKSKLSLDEIANLIIDSFNDGFSVSGDLLFLSYSESENFKKEQVEQMLAFGLNLHREPKYGYYRIMSKTFKIDLSDNQTDHCWVNAI